MCNRRLLISLMMFLGAAAGMAAAQTAPSDAYAQEPFVIQSIATRYVYQDDGTAATETTAQVKVNTEAGVKQFGILAFPYEKDAEEMAVQYVRVRKPDGTVVVTPAADVQDVDTEVSRVAPMYSDLRQKHVVVRNLSIGDVIEYQSHSTLHTPLAPGQFWAAYNFYRDGIVLDEQVEIDVPRDRYVNVKSADVKPTVREAGARKIYLWKTSNLRRKTDEEKAKESKKEAPPPSIQLSTFKSWDEIAKWYADLQRERVKPSAEIRAKALEVTKDAKSDEEKLRAIYKYVSNEIRYVGLEFGVGRYQPHAADEVFQNRYGDCKDKQTLLAAMLDAAGIQAEPVLLNSSRTVDEEVPSPAQFDHVIGVVRLGGRDFWLDTTPEVSPFGLLLYSYRDKRVLIAGDKAEWRKTPANAPVETAVVFESEGKLNGDGEFSGKIRRTYRGDPEVLVRLALRNVGQPHWKELVQQISYSTGFAGTVNDVSVSSPAETEEPLEIKYSYVRKDYSDWSNRRITPPMPPLSITPLRPDDTDKSSDPITLSGPFQETLRSKIQLPDGYTPEMLPDVTLHTDFADYQSHYELHGMEVTAVRELKVKQRELARSRSAEFNKFAKAVTDDENSYIVLKSGGGTSDALAAVGAALGVSGTDAQRLFEEGRSQLQARNVDKAYALFQRVVAIDSKYPGVWMGIAFCRFSKNETEEALKALRTEIANHPGDSSANLTLAQTLFGMKRTDEGMEMLRTYIKSAPKDARATAMMGAALLQQSKYSEAAEFLQSAASTDPKNVAVRRQLGDVYVKLGKRDEAVAELKEAVALQPFDPLTLNDAAYFLADGNMGLDLAEEWATKAVNTLSQQTLLTDLSSLESSDLQRMNSLGSYWDTLGWVYFRRGELGKAGEYLRAAWDLAQAPVMAEHLGEVYEKQGQAAKAAKFYAMAYRGPMMTRAGIKIGSDEASARIAKLVGRVEASKLLNKAGEEMSQARTSHVPNVAKATVTGEFFLLFVQGKLDSVKFISGEAALNKSADALRTALAPKLHAYVPAYHEVKLVRRAIVVCSQSRHLCDVALMTPDTVRDVY